MRRLVLLLPLLTVAACADRQVTDVTVRTVAEAEISLAAAERAALTYTRLPACPGPTLCADPIVKGKILAYDALAYDAVRQARANTGTIAAAAAAVTTLWALLPAAVVK